MSETSVQEQKGPRDAEHWAQPVSKIRVTDVPRGAVNLNVDGRLVVGPLQGFGQMWQKTYRVRLPSLTLSSKQVMDTWKAEFPNFQPPASHFYPPMTGIEPGKVIFIELNLPVVEGVNLIPVASGVMVMYADDEMFTVTTPEGFPVSGWNTFSVHEEDGCVIAQIQSIDRATDPIYEFGTLVMGGAARQEENWVYVLTRLSERFGIKGQVQMHKVCVDPRWQWSEARNLWKNAGVRTFFYKLAAPLRWVRKLAAR
jgi:hypothetical protein